MGYYAIGIGGTGAKCLEALVHLAAAGMMPDDELYVLFVDPDTANGSLDGAQQTLTRYMRCKDALQLGKASLFKNKIVSAEPNVWTPFEDKARQTLNQFFYYDDLSMAKDQNRRAAAHLFELLFSKQERGTSLEYGFRGHPSIGSAVMARTVDLGETEPWGTFRQRIANDEQAKVFLIGSIFGGTGASGFPTIARLVKNKLGETNAGERAVLGGALVLPYFYFLSQDSPELQAKSEAFLMNTQAALKYYYLWSRTDIYKAVYFFGDDARTQVEPCLGGQQQRNAPHFIELYAALAAIDFFEKDFEGDEPTQYFMTARHEENTLQWKDLPDGNHGQTTQSRLGNLARFAFAFLSVYHPMLEDIRKEGKIYRAPWYIDFFERDAIRIGDNYTQTALSNVEDYCRALLLWFASIQENHGEKTRIELIKSTAYSTKGELKSVNSFEPRDFSNLIRDSSPRKEDPKALSKLWERMSARPPSDPEAQGVGQFLSALFRNCDV